MGFKYSSSEAQVLQKAFWRPPRKGQGGKAKGSPAFPLESEQLRSHLTDKVQAH